MICSHHQNGVFSRRISWYVIACIVIVMNAFERFDVTIAVRQKHRKWHAVDDLIVEVDGSQREYRLDSIRRSQRLIQLELAHHPFSAARVAHRADALHIYFTNKQVSKRSATHGVESVPKIQMQLDQSSARQGAA